MGLPSSGGPINNRPRWRTWGRVGRRRCRKANPARANHRVAMRGQGAVLSATEPASMTLAGSSRCGVTSCSGQGDGTGSGGAVPGDIVPPGFRRSDPTSRSSRVRSGCRPFAVRGGRLRVPGQPSFWALSPSRYLSRITPRTTWPQIACSAADAAGAPAISEPLMPTARSGRPTAGRRWSSTH